MAEFNNENSAGDPSRTNNYSNDNSSINFRSRSLIIDQRPATSRFELHMFP
jgi:hypothetical protein